MIRTMLIVIGIALSLAPLSYAEETTNPIKIGVIYGFTGAAQKWAEFGKKGFDLAVEEINSTGEINGRPLRVILRTIKLIRNRASLPIVSWFH